MFQKGEGAKDRPPPPLYAYLPLHITLPVRPLRTTSRSTELHVEYSLPLPRVIIHGVDLAHRLIFKSGCW